MAAFLVGFLTMLTVIMTLYFFLEVLISVDIKPPRRKKSKKPVGPVTLNDLADSYERQAALLIKDAEENARGGYGALARRSNEEATRLLKQAKAARKQYLDELMEL